MRISIVLNADKDIVLPVQYNHILQGFLYNSISDQDYRQFLHHTGYEVNNKVFRLFTFSRILGTFRMNRTTGTITFQPPIHIVISSPLEAFITDLAESLIKSDMLFLGHNILEIASINVYRKTVFHGSVQVKMLSPMVAYSTVIEDGKKRTEYFSPWKSRFSEIARQNLLSKYQILYGESPQNQEFTIIPNGMQERKFKIVANYKGTIIEAYNGIYWLKGNPELIEVAYETGLGSKNSQGFGCWEVVG
ncbi:MAG: CRISPR-associated endoribonuclease Cas6 [Syntrophomonadaceae bacterium]